MLCGKTRLLRRIGRFLLVFQAYCAVAGASAQLEFAATGRRVSLPTVISRGTELVPVAAVCRELGHQCEWDRGREALVCTGERLRIDFIAGNRFCAVGDSLIQLACALERTTEGLYAHPRVLADLLSRAVGPWITWEQDSNALVVGEKAGDRPDGTREMPSALTGPVTERKSREREGRIGVVVIDAGHGGKDPGAIGASGLQEKDVVLPVALALRDDLEKLDGLEVYLTRDTDVFVPLRERTKFANSRKADLFISIHANSISGNKKKNQIKGYKVYFLSQAKNEEDKRVAMIENSVIEFEEETEGNGFLESILTDMANNEYLTESQDLSICIEGAFAGALQEVRKLHRGVGQANFWVLNGAYMPSVLIEIAFISNPSEEKLLRTEKFQRRVAGAIAEAITEFRRKYEVGQ